jgi:hypothetical protein
MLCYNLLGGGWIHRLSICRLLMMKAWDVPFGWSLYASTASIPGFSSIMVFQSRESRCLALLSYQLLCEPELVQFPSLIHHLEAGEASLATPSFIVSSRLKSSVPLSWSWLLVSQCLGQKRTMCCVVSLSKATGARSTLSPRSHWRCDVLILDALDLVSISSDPPLRPRLTTANHSLDDHVDASCCGYHHLVILGARFLKQRRPSHFWFRSQCREY